METDASIDWTLVRFGTYGPSHGRPNRSTRSKAPGPAPGAPGRHLRPAADRLPAAAPVPDVDRQEGRHGRHRDRLPAVPGRAHAGEPEGVPRPRRLQLLRRLAP